MQTRSLRKAKQFFIIRLLITNTDTINNFLFATVRTAHLLSVTIFVLILFAEFHSFSLIIPKKQKAFGLNRRGMNFMPTILPC